MMNNMNGGFDTLAVAPLHLESALYINLSLIAALEPKPKKPLYRAKQPRTCLFNEASILAD